MSQPIDWKSLLWGRKLKQPLFVAMDHFLGSMSQPIDWKSLLNFSEL